MLYKKGEGKIDTLIKVFKSISDITRLRIIKILQEKDELCVCEIVQALDISQTRASRNLGILKNAGFVVDRRDGLWIYYSINKEMSNQYHMQINILIKDWLNNEKIVQKDKEQLKKINKSTYKNLCNR